MKLIIENWSIRKWPSFLYITKTPQCILKQIWYESVSKFLNGNSWKIKKEKVLFIRQFRHYLDFFDKKASELEKVYPKFNLQHW